MDSAERSVSRRQILAAASLGAVVGNALIPGRAPSASAAEPSKAAVSPGKPFRYALNMSTIREQKLSVPEQIAIAAKAGYDAIEPWMGELHAFVDQGGKTADLRKQIEDSGLTVDSAIGFAEWIVDDDERRKKALEVARRDMQLLSEIGGKRIAAPPTGATRQSDLSLVRAAERYHALLEVGREMGVTPQLELWGFSQTLSRLGELLFVASESNHPDACVLADVYHIYKGGSAFSGLHWLNGQKMHVFHMNDYPAEPARDAINDSHRVYPGDGVAPLTAILKDLHAVGFSGTLSLELFNPEYWKRDAFEVAETGLKKMQATVRQSFG